MRNYAEILLGCSLGLGYLTSLRFFGPVGISEILMLLLIAILARRHLLEVFRFRVNVESFVRAYLLFSFIIVMPATTLTVFFLTSYNSLPIYVLSFVMGLFLSLLLVEAFKVGFDLRVVTMWFAWIFIASNALTIILAAETSHRYSGFANNPNQLLFYAGSLSFMLVMFGGRSAFFALPLLIWVMLETESDAYNLSLIVAVVIYLLLRIFYLKKFNVGANALFMLLLLAPVVSYLLYFHLDYFSQAWQRADEGSVRLSLMKNGMIAALHSPLFGFGSGSFSGVDQPFSGSEVHNNFLDFATQIGFPFAIFIYCIFFSFLYRLLLMRHFLGAAFLLAFIVSTLFHFSGRHFAFWVMLAIFYADMYYKVKRQGERRSSIINFTSY